MAIPVDKASFELSRRFCENLAGTEGIKFCLEHPPDNRDYFRGKWKTLLSPSECIDRGS